MDEQLGSIQDELYEYSTTLLCLSKNVKWIKYFDDINMSTELRNLLYHHIMNRRIHHGKTLYRTSIQYLLDTFDIECIPFVDETAFYIWLEKLGFTKVKINNRSDNYYVLDL